MLTRKFLTIVLLFWVSIFWINAQDYKFRTLSPDGGFYYDGVLSIEQDNNGFIWVVMENELYRFDGYQYKRYGNLFREIDPSARWIFMNIAIGQDLILVNTNNGLYKYNIISDSFERIYDNVSVIKFDKKNNLWIRNDGTWHILNIQDGTIETPLYDGSPISYMGPAFCTYNDDLYLFTNHSRIYRFNYNKREFNLCFKTPEEHGNILAAKAYKGKLWMYVQKYGLYKIDLSTFNLEGQFDFYNGDNNASVRAFYLDKYGDIWFGTMNGIHILNPESKEWKHFSHSKVDPFSLPNNSIWTIGEDKQQNVWIGTYSGKIAYVNLEEKDVFETYKPEETQLNHTPISAFAEDSKYIWVGTEGGGINRINKTTQEFTYFTSNSTSHRIEFDNIKSIIVDKDENLWIAMYTGGLDYYNTKTNQRTNFKPDGTENSLITNSIRKIILEPDSGLWIVYQYAIPIISYFSFEKKSFTHLEIDKEAESLYLFDMIRTGDNQLWLINNEKLYKVDTNTYTVEAIESDASTFMNFQTLCSDHSGNIWIGTIGNGFIKYDPNTATYTSFTDVLNYNINSIYSICNDDEGNLWMGTDNGLIRYNIAQNSFSKYDKKDGVQGQVYYPLASMKGANGELYFGGTNGFTIVDPKNISYNSYKPKVIISDFFIDHKPSKINISAKDSSFIYDELILKYDQQNFGFKFSSDNYLIPEKNHYKYRLKGYDDRWIEVDASNRTALYSKVPAGTYYFEVLAANNDGIWSDTPAVIKIVRKPAPWFSWWAYILYFLVSIAIIYFILRYYIDKKKLKNQLYIENLEKEKKEQIHQAQLRFFTNISHDFRTPLSLILAALERLRQEGLKEYYYKILNNNSQRLLNLINELMDFRTVENGKMKLGVEPTDINLHIEELASDFSDYAKQQNITFNILKDKQLPLDIYVDKHIVEKIVMNLLNNAFKYTTEGGSIEIKTYLDPDAFTSRFETSYTIKGETVTEEYFSIVVSDTGVGISKESIASVFERFYKVNTVNTDSHLGTGIGLALVKSLVLLHKGSITIYSERDKGTDMVVNLPLDKNIYNDNEILQNEDFIKITQENKKEAQQDAINTEYPKEILEKKILLRDKKRILLAEDNDDLRDLVAKTLSEEYEVVEAANGMIASKLIQEMDIDLVISDIMMPFKDGVQLCHETKNDMSTSHIPFILLTAKTSLESKIEGADSGADIYLEKPIDLNLLKISIYNIFKHQQHLKEYYAKNYFVDSAELSSNEHDNKFLKKFIEIVEANIDQPEMDVNYIAKQLSMSRSKLYTKIKTLTDKSIVEFLLGYRMRKAARLIIEEDMTMSEVMTHVGLESQSYFTNAFKKEFGETPTSFASKHKKNKAKK